MSDWPDVAKVLLGSWPTQVAVWGREGIAAYVAELEPRGLTPDAAIDGLRRWPDPKWPPSAGELVSTALADPSEPTFDEMLILVRRAAKRDGQDDRALAHPLVASFVARQGWDRLRLLPIDDPDWGEKHRRDLYGAWERHRESHDHRQVAALASGRGDLAQLDPLAALGLPRSAGELVVSNDNQRRAR